MSPEICRKAKRKPRININTLFQFARPQLVYGGTMPTIGIRQSEPTMQFQTDQSSSLRKPFLI